MGENYDEMYVTYTLEQQISYDEKIFLAANGASIKLHYALS